jgi:hypothetical protein
MEFAKYEACPSFVQEKVVIARKEKLAERAE